jgi:hypothetical protein
MYQWQFSILSLDHVIKHSSTVQRSTGTSRENGDWPRKHRIPSNFRWSLGPFWKDCVLWFVHWRPQLNQNVSSQEELKIA